nr:hypothetical protein HmN_000775000 [Hymenolepis microstoma]
MYPTALTRVSQQTDAADVLSGEGYRHVLNMFQTASVFYYESSTNGAYFVGGPYGPAGRQRVKFEFT